MTPIFASACDLAHRIPTMTAEFLELEGAIGRRFREDSVTDIIIASLLKIGGENATILAPLESRTGGDFDIILYDRHTNDKVQYRIQAKRLTPNKENWAWGYYRELDHPHGTGKQAATLIRSSASESIITIPLYAFYNPLSTCMESGKIVSGIELADGRTVASIIRDLVKIRESGKRPRRKRIEYLQHLFFPLSTILCRSADLDSGLVIISPTDSRLAVELAIQERRRIDEFAKMWMPDGIPPHILTSGAELEPSQKLEAVTALEIEAVERRRRKLPLVIERALARRTTGPAIQRARVKRPKLILVTGSTLSAD